MLLLPYHVRYVFRQKAIDAVNKGITNDDLDIGLQIGSAIQYAIRNGHIEATKAIEVED